MSTMTAGPLLEQPRELTDELRTMMFNLESGQVAGLVPEVRRLLARIAGGDVSFPVLRHPLGFLYFPLLRDGDCVLRLHIWPEDRPTPPLTTSQYHTHTWDLTSLVLAGEVTNDLLTVVPVAKNPQYRVFSINGVGQDDAIVATDLLIDTDIFSSETYRAGDRYTIPTGVYHATTLPADAFAATLVVVRRRNRGPEMTLGPIDMPTHSTFRAAATEADSQAAAARLLRHLGSD
jgi:hypothetical protein